MRNGEHMQNGHDGQATDATQATLSGAQLHPQLDPQLGSQPGTVQEGLGGSLTMSSHPQGSMKRFDLGVAEDVTLLLGRGRGADLDLDDTRVSRRHAQITVRGGKHFIEDLGSIAGTEVNGSPVQGSVEMRHGDQIQAGQTGLVYAAPGKEPVLFERADSEDTVTAVPLGSSEPAPVFRPEEMQASYRRSLAAVVGLIAMILVWMLIETF